MPPSHQTTAEFDAVIYPNQPMPKSQVRWILFTTSFVAIMMGTMFAIAGAWPIAGFFGLDILLLFMGFHLVRKQAARTERVRLDRNGLLVEADDGRGKQHRWQFEPYWVRVHMDNPPTRRSLVTLHSHGTVLKLGSFLTPDERLTFAQALREALRRWR